MSEKRIYWITASDCHYPRGGLQDLYGTYECTLDDGILQLQYTADKFNDNYTLYLLDVTDPQNPFTEDFIEGTRSL